MRKVFYNSFDYTLATMVVPKIAHILGNSFHPCIFVTMNFSDRCDTLHVFHLPGASLEPRLFTRDIVHAPYVSSLFLFDSSFDAPPHLFLRSPDLLETTLLPKNTM